MKLQCYSGLPYRRDKYYLRLRDHPRPESRRNFGKKGSNPDLRDKRRVVYGSHTGFEFQHLAGEYVRWTNPNHRHLLHT